MKIIKTILEEVTIYYKDSERGKVDNFIFDNGYRLIRSGLVVKKLGCVKDSYKVVGQRIKEKDKSVFDNVKG